MKNVLNILQKFDRGAKELSSGDIKLRCPFRENHTDGSGRESMFVKASVNKYHCFSCGAKGKATTLLTNKFDIPLFEAVDYVSLDDIDESTFVPYEDVESDKPHNKATLYVPERLLTFTPPKYLLERGFEEQLLRKFKVGFYIDEDTGVETTTIPIYQDSKLVGVKYRVQEPVKAFWYSEGFERRKILYNEGDWASVILVESETDTFRSVQNGKQNTVATLGTEISQGQVERLSKYEKVYIAHDNDAPGILAKEVAYQFLKNKVEVLFIPYTASDPGDCGKEDWLHAFKNATDYSVYAMEMATHMGDEYLQIQRKAREKVFTKKH